MCIRDRYYHKNISVTISTGEIVEIVRGDLLQLKKSVTVKKELWGAVVVYLGYSLEYVSHVTAMNIRRMRLYYFDPTTSSISWTVPAAVKKIII